MRRILHSILFVLLLLPAASHAQVMSFEDMSDLSAQEQTLIKLFRETTEEGRLEMISAFMTIKNDIEKKNTGENTAFVG